MLEIGNLHPPLELCVDARAVYDAVSASDACEPAACSLKLHLTSVRDRTSHGLIRRCHWVDTRDMLAAGLTKGGHRSLLASCGLQRLQVRSKARTLLSQQSQLCYQLSGRSGRRLRAPYSAARFGSRLRAAYSAARFGSSR